MRRPPARRVLGARIPGRGPAVLLALLAVLFLGAGCTTAPPVAPPAGFAVYDDPAAMRAVSPDGVRYRVHYAENDPEQSLEFWREALSLHLERSGYGALGEQSISTPAGPGALFEWVAPVGPEEWIYLTAVVPAGQKLIIAEAAGPADLYRAHRDALVMSLETIGRE